MLAYTINITQILQGCGHERLQSAEPFDEAFGNCVRNSGDAVKQAVAARLQGSVEFVIAEPCGLGDHSEVHNIHVGKVAQSPSCDGDALRGGSRQVVVQNNVDTRHIGAAELFELKRHQATVHTEFKHIVTDFRDNAPHHLHALQSDSDIAECNV